MRTLLTQDSVPLTKACGSTKRAALSLVTMTDACSLRSWAAAIVTGVRVDGGYENGETIPGAFDSLIAKLIITGRDRTQALERSRRALDEFVVDGMPTVIPFHRAVVSDPAYVGASTPSGEGEFTVGDGSPGEVTMALRDTLTGIQRGTFADTHDWMTRLR